MTKTDEIALLEKTIARFGVNSYLGPWLAANREQLVRDIQDDLPPSMELPQDARRQAVAIVADAMAQARDTRQRSERDAAAAADRIRDKAYEDAARIRSNAVTALRQALRAVEA